jgi:hypothetical protein
LSLPFSATPSLEFVAVWPQKYPFLGGLQDFKIGLNQSLLLFFFTESCYFWLTSRAIA